MLYRITKESGYTLIQLGGFLDYKSIKGLMDQLDNIYKSSPNTQLVIDLKHLRFVGSTGISLFVKDLSFYNKVKNKPLFSGLKAEFNRLFELYDQQGHFAIYNTQNEAINFIKIHKRSEQPKQEKLA